MDKESRWAVELLLREAGELYQEGRFAESLRAADKAAEAARELGDVGLEIKAVTAQADALYALGENATALARYSWILGVASDPSRRVEVERAGVSWEIANAYGNWADTARFLPEVPTEGLLAVLDAGESYVKGIGKPGWRAGLLRYRAIVLWNLGRREQAIGVAEEGLSLMQRDGSGPGSTLAGHRWGLGDMLLQVKRYEGARMQYQAVVDAPESALYDRTVATQGLAYCALAVGDTAKARKLALEAVRLTEGMGDNLLASALEVLVEACRKAGDLPAARAASERRMAGARRLGSAQRLYFALRDAADVALDEQDADKARALIEEAKLHAEAIDQSRGTTLFRDEIQVRRKRLAGIEGAGREGEEG